MAKLAYVTDLVFEDQSNPVTTGDNKFRLKVPFDGEILGGPSGPKITGHIQDAGSGAGSATTIQIRNVTQSRDYFTTKPKFEVDDADGNGRAVLAGGQLATNVSFRANDVLALDIDAVPTNGDSGQLVVYLTVQMFREV